MNEQKRIEELKKREAELSGELRSLNKLHRLSAELLRPADLNTALNLILDGSMEIVGAAMGNVQMYDPALKSLKIVVQRGFDQEFFDSFREVSVDDDTACARPMAARDQLIIEDIERDPLYEPYRSIAVAAGYRAVQSTPLLSRAGELLGIVSTHFRQPHRPSERELRMLDLYVAHATDSIERIRAEETVRRNNDLCRAIGDSIPYGIWMCDTAGRNTHASDSFLALIGLTQAEYSDFGWNRVLHPEDADGTKTAWQQCVRTGAPWDREYRVKGVDGQWHPILARGMPVRDDAGNISAWVGINLDIGNRVRIRELARRQTEILDQSHDAIFQWQFDGGILDWNRGSERLYGFSRDEALGQVPPELLQTQCPGGIEAVKQTLRRDGIWNGELRHRTKDGKEIFVESRMLLWRHAELPPIIIEVNHDITDRKRAEAALRENEQKLKDQANELEQQLIASGRLVALGQVTASMAHEFNNPLGIIIGFVEDLLSTSAPDAPDHRSLQIIHQESERCKKIVEDLMAYARPRAAEMSLVKIEGVIDRTLGMVDALLFKQKVQVVKDVASDLPRIQADSQQLSQVLVNLYLNAIDAMPNGGKLTVGARLSGGSSSNAVVLSVADTGTGIESADFGKIFQPFYTAKKRRGLGLGLPICERIVKNHGGEIKVESQSGKGATFKIHLPLNQGIAPLIAHSETASGGQEATHERAGIAAVGRHEERTKPFRAGR